MRRVQVVVTCDHPNCPTALTGPAGTVAVLAAQFGWTLNPDRCPQHKETPDG
jgi:hypothetical protein